MSEYPNTMTGFTTAAAASGTTAETIERITKVMRDFDREFPVHNRVVAIELSLSSELLDKVMLTQTGAETFQPHLYGLPVYWNEQVPADCHVVRMADGSRVLL